MREACGAHHEAQRGRARAQNSICLPLRWIYLALVLMRILPACVAGVVLAVGCLMGCKGKNPVSAKPEPRATWMDPRVWTASDGRTLEGALVARMGEDGVVRRAVDGVFLRLPPRFLNSDNLSFLNNAFQSGSIPTTLPNLWYGSRCHGCNRAAHRKIGNRLLDPYERTRRQRCQMGPCRQSFLFESPIRRASAAKRTGDADERLGRFPR
jgi:hypothetical protein